MPEIRVLKCDAPDCTNDGDIWKIEQDGRAWRVILCHKHGATLAAVAQWGAPGEPTRPRTKRERRGTDRARVLRLIDADKPAGERYDPLAR